MIKKSALLFAAAMSVASVAQALSIDVNFGDFAPNTPITTQIEGATFYLAGGPYSNGAPVTGGFGGTGLANSTTTDYPTAAILGVTFSGVASNVSFNFNNYGSSSFGTGQSFYSAFDSLGALLESGFVGYGGAFALASSNIANLQFNNNSGGSDSWLFTLDTLSAEVTTATVPEPTTVALLGLGLLGVAASRRKAAKK